MFKTVFRSLALAALFINLSVALPVSPAAAQTASPMQISWEVRNRFRLFREERDFLLHTDAGRGRTVLAAEQALGIQSDGRGWARNTVGRLCIDVNGRVAEPCTRDNVKESYLTPIDHPVTVRLAGQVPVGATCAWNFDDGDGPQSSTFDCAEPVNLRVRYGRTTVASVDVASAEGTERATAEIAVRDLFIAGLGDSIASGEGNPDRPIALADDGFCFRSYLATAASQYYRPSRAGYKGGRACESPEALQVWQRQSAYWLNPACHRSLYSYQTRTALQLAVQYPHVAVTYLPLACTGATIDYGLFGSQRFRECPPSKSGSPCQGTVNGQIAELREALNAAKRRQPERRLDLVLLSIGANDIYFSGLVADVIVENPTERVLFRRGGVMATTDDARSVLARDLPQGFAKVREALRPLVGEMSRVVYTSYANPTLASGGAPCPGGRAGFEVHPSFNAEPRRLANVSAFVENEFLPQLKSLALCEGGILCRNPQADRMTFVDAHQSAFVGHGFCMRAQTDPEFDRDCFASNGESFNTDLVTAAGQPMVCGRSPSEYRAYLPRARWVRDANDSYFAAMTYPQGLSSMQPSDIHDATWGVLSAVYGGAVHPSAEGHAAMADAATPAAAAVLQLDTGAGEVFAQPVAPVGGR